MTFVDFYVGLERARSLDNKVAHCERYFRGLAADELEWAMNRLLGKTPRSISAAELSKLACKVGGIDDGLWAACVAATGSVAEAAALACHGEGRLGFCELSDTDADIGDLWSRADGDDCYVLNRLRLGIVRQRDARRFLVPGISRAFGVPEEVVALGLARSPLKMDWLEASAVETGHRRFASITPIKGNLSSLGPRSKWDAHVLPTGGVRTWLVVDHGHWALLTHQGEPAKWAEATQSGLPERLGNGTVLDGIVAGGRFVAIDALALGGTDVSRHSLSVRLELLRSHVVGTGVALADSCGLAWEDLPANETLLIRRLDSLYPPQSATHGWRMRSPATRRLFAVMMYAHRGADRGYDSLTVGLRGPDGFVSVGKVQPNLKRSQRDELAEWIRMNTLERVGPVRTVPEVQVLEVSFEAAVRSKRHKCGFVLHGLKLVAWHPQRTTDEVVSLAILSELPTS